MRTWRLEDILPLPSVLYLICLAIPLLSPFGFLTFSRVCKHVRLASFYLIPKSKSLRPFNCKVLVSQNLLAVIMHSQWQVTPALRDYWRKNTFLKSILIILCVWVFACMLPHASASEGQKKVSVLWIRSYRSLIMSCHLDLEIEPQSPGRVASVLNH